MKVPVDQEKCVAGQRVHHAGEVFEQGVVIVLNENPPAEEADAVRQAAAICPALAIHVEE
jgi:ferredoxin